MTEKSRQLYALKAFEHTADYDTAISDFFRKQYAGDGLQQLSLRYGANPHQKTCRGLCAGTQSPLQGPQRLARLHQPPRLTQCLAIGQRAQRSARLSRRRISFKHVSPAGAAIGVPLERSRTQSLHGRRHRRPLRLQPGASLRSRPRRRPHVQLRRHHRPLRRSRHPDRQDHLPRSLRRSHRARLPTRTPSRSSARRKPANTSSCKWTSHTRLRTQETRTVYGVHADPGPQRRPDHAPQTPSPRSSSRRTAPPLPEPALRDLTVATIALKYTQSNSVCYALNGQVIGLGAGQQSRIHCTRLAGDKADNWWMRFHERALGIRGRQGRSARRRRTRSICCVRGWCRGRGPSGRSGSGISRRARRRRCSRRRSGEEWLRQAVGGRVQQRRLLPLHR